jgi:site-specific recombinase XerD
MLNLRRRHLRACAHRSGLYLKCKCPLWAVGTSDGKFIRKALDTRNLERGSELIRELEAGGGVSVSIEVACDRFLADVRARGLSTETVKKLERLTDELKGYFDGAPLTSITADDLGRFREKWKARPSTSRKKLERLRSLFKFCVERDWIKKNPAKLLRPPKESVIERRPFEKEELEKIGWGVGLFPAKGIYGEENEVRIRAFLAVLRWTGLRIRDVVQLKRTQVIGGSVILRTHKNQKPVKLPLHKEAVEALGKMKNGGDYFFWSGEGNAKSCVGDWQRTLRRLSELSGVHVHAHRYRHTFATDLLSKGVPVSEVAAILGNSARIIERHYAQWIESRQVAIDLAVKKAWA